MSERVSEHDCPCCTCGKIELSWSDRITHAFPDDYHSLACAVMCCALDRSYDRAGDGVPYGFTGAQRAACAPIVDKYLSAVNPKWREHTVDISPTAHASMLAELEAALRTLGHQ